LKTNELLTYWSKRSHASSDEVGIDVLSFIYLSPIIASLAIESADAL